MRLAGRAEDALRDPWYLRPAGADPGPAGAVLGAWRQLSVQPPAGSADRLEKIVDQLGLHCHRAALADLCTEIEKLAGSQRPVPFAATAIAARVAAIRPDPELLAWCLPTWCWQHQPTLEAVVSCDNSNRLQYRSRRRLKPIRTRKSKYLSNRIEQDHRRIKRRIGSMLGFKSPGSAAIILNGIKMVHMISGGHAVPD